MKEYRQAQNNRKISNLRIYNKDERIDEKIATGTFVSKNKVPRKWKLLIIGIVATASVGTIINNQYQEHKQQLEIVSEHFQEYDIITIKPGSTLEGIARTYYECFPDVVKENLSLKQYISDVMSLNGIGNPDRIIAGDLLSLPVYSENKKEIDNTTTIKK